MASTAMGRNGSKVLVDREADRSLFDAINYSPAGIPVVELALILMIRASFLWLKALSLKMMLELISNERQWKLPKRTKKLDAGVSFLFRSLPTGIHTATTRNGESACKESFREGTVRFLLGGGARDWHLGTI